LVLIMETVSSMLCTVQNEYFFFVIKPTTCTNFTNLYCHETQHVLDSSSVIQLSSRTRMELQFHPGPCSKAVWHMPLLSVQWINSWWWTDELSETCRVSWQNKFVKLNTFHLVVLCALRNYVTLKLYAVLTPIIYFNLLPISVSDSYP